MPLLSTEQIKTELESCNNKIKEVTGRCPTLLCVPYGDYNNAVLETPEALPNILKYLKDKGYEFVFIENLIYKKDYEIKHDGTQCKIL